MTAAQRNSRQVRLRIREERVYWSKPVDIHVKIVNGEPYVCGYMAASHRADAMRRRPGRLRGGR